MRPPAPLSVMTFPLLFSLDTFIPSGWSNFGSVASLMSRMRSFRDLMETDDAIEEALAEWEGTRGQHGDDALSLDLDDYVGLDFADLARRAYPSSD